VAEILKKGLFHHMLDRALHVACMRGHLAVVELLLAQRTPLLYDQCVLDIIAEDTRLPSHIAIVRCLLRADRAGAIRVELYEELTRDTWPELSAVLRDYLP
jgi:hypothetical protein